MPITLPDTTQQQAVASIERYFREHMDEPIGNVAAAARRADCRVWPGSAGTSSWP